MAKQFGDGIPIPDVIDPLESMEMTLCIPKNRDHMSAFFGALYQLTLWQSWQEDDAHSGAELAKVWWRYYLSWNRSMSDLDCEDGMSKCCTPNPEIRRIDPDTERPQISYDNGATWQPSPDDTQGAVTLLPPIVRSGSPSSKCDAATNAIQHINELITATGENLSTAADVFTLAVAVAEAALALFLIIVSAGTLTAPVVAVATAIWAAATGVFALGIDGYNAYWTTDKQDLIFCKIVCNIGENGQFTEAQYQAFRAEVKEALPASPALDVVMSAINAGGAQGLSQMASYGSWATADCDSCHCDDTWCFDGDFTVERFDAFFQPFTVTSQPVYYNTSWVEGTGWITANPSPNYSAIQFALANIPGIRVFRWVGTGADLNFHDTQTDAGVPNAPSYIGNEMYFDGTETYSWFSFGKRDQSALISFHAEGVGESPFGTNNC